VNRSPLRKAEGPKLGGRLGGHGPTIQLVEGRRGVKIEVRVRGPMVRAMVSLSALRVAIAGRGRPSP